MERGGGAAVDVTNPLTHKRPVGQGTHSGQGRHSAGGRSSEQKGTDIELPTLGGQADDSQLLSADDGDGGGEEEKAPPVAHSLGAAIGVKMRATEALLLLVFVAAIVAPMLAIMQKFLSGDFSCSVRDCVSGFRHQNASNSEYACLPLDGCTPGETAWNPRTSACESYEICTDSTFTFAGTGCDTETYTCASPAWGAAGACYTTLATPACVFAPDGDETQNADYRNWDGATCNAFLVSCNEQYGMGEKLTAGILGMVTGQLLVTAVISFLFRRAWPGRYNTKDRLVPLRVITVHWLWELIQFSFTVAGIASFLNWTYTVQFTAFDVPDSDGNSVRVYDYALPPGLDFVRFVVMEVTLASAYGFDFIVRMLSSENKFKHVFNFYGLVDFFAFAALMYPPIFQINSPYSGILVSGALRIIRARRALKVLDRIRRGRTIGFLCFKLSARGAALTLLGARVVMFILCSAVLVMIFEVPCPGLYDDGRCDDDFNVFHMVVYYIIVTFSTVGYGDISPVTTGGRMLAIVLIVVMLIQVPVEIAKISAFFEGESQMDKVEQRLNRLDRDLRARFAIPDTADASGSAAATFTQEQLQVRLRRLHDTNSLRRLCAAAGVAYRDNETAAEGLIAALFGVAHSRAAAHAHEHAGGPPGMLGAITDAVRTGRAGSVSQITS